MSTEEASSSQSDQSGSAQTSETPLLSEQLLIQSLSGFQGSSGLVISPGRAQTARLLADEMKFNCVHAWYLDLHDATIACQAFADWNESSVMATEPESASSGTEAETETSDAAAGTPAPIEVLAGPDLPTWSGEGYDLIAMATLKRSESELTRDLLQQAHQRLREGGHLVASVDHAKDNWLHDQMRGMFDKVTCERKPRGCVYSARKTKPLKKVRDFSCEFDFKDGEHILVAQTRPGVFSHRRLDPGAKQLMLCSEIAEDDDVLDMGCGCGALTMAIAKRTQGQVYGVDSNARAIDCLKAGVERNQLSNVTAIWNADGHIELPQDVDVALANPPYYGDDAIGQHFVETALSVLRVGGALLVVSKQPGWYEAYFDTCMEDIVTFEAGHYFVTCGRKLGV